jgi:hypothetical protein
MESAQAIAAHLTSTNLKLGASAFRHIVIWTATLMALPTSRSVGQVVTRQAKLMETVARSAMTASKMSASTARLAGHGLEPIRVRATANAKRLGKR